jgi:hypothetical protein
MRYDHPPTFSHGYGQMMGAVPFDTPWTPEGPLAPPGTYSLKLTVDGKSYMQTVLLKNDPRSPASAAALAAQHVLLTKLYNGSREAWDGYQQVTEMRSAVGVLMGSNQPAPVDSAVRAFSAKLVSAGGNGGGGRAGGGGGGRGGAAAGPPPAPNFAALIGAMNRQLDALDAGDLAPTEPMMRAWSWVCSDLRTAVNNWKTVNMVDLPKLNSLLTANGGKALAPGTSGLAVPVCSTEAAKH